MLLLVDYARPNSDKMIQAKLYNTLARNFGNPGIKSHKIFLTYVSDKSPFLQQKAFECHYYVNYTDGFEVILRYLAIVFYCLRGH